MYRAAFLVWAVAGIAAAATLPERFSASRSHPAIEYATRPDGQPFSAVTVDHRTSVEARWGGWYVTGRTGLGRHVGNTVATDPDQPMMLASDENLNLATVDGRFDTRGYLTPYSDIAALMVLEHQTQMTNLLTRVGWEARIALHEGRATSGLFTRPAVPAGDAVVRAAVRGLVDYMLFVDEAPLTDRMEGTSGFTETFAARGPFDRRGRTLRELDLDRRLMRYPCSYMIYSAAFDALPMDARDAIYQRMWQILSGEEVGEKHARLPAADRQAIVEILRDTKPALPDYFHSITR